MPATADWVKYLLFEVNQPKTSEVLNVRRLDKVRLHIYAVGSTAVADVIVEESIDEVGWSPTKVYASVAVNEEAITITDPMPYLRVRVAAYTSGGKINAVREELE